MVVFSFEGTSGNIEAKFEVTPNGVTVLKDPSGYLYQKNRLANDLTYWKCRRYQNLKCRARAVTKGFVIKSLSGTHIHTED